MEKLKDINWKTVPWITAGLIVINAVIFLVTDLGGENFSTLFFYRFAQVWPGVPGMPETGQWYRLITACFLHNDFEHVASNMFMLALLGNRLEKKFGRPRYLILYLLSGIGGSGASLFYHWKTMQPFMACGASGAIYGVVGALLAVLLIHGGFIDGVGLRQILFMIAFMIYSSTIGENIDVAAHIGGLVTGFLLGLLLVKLPHIRYIDKKRKRP